MDRAVIGGAAGAIAGIVIGIISHVLYLFNFFNLCLIAIGGGLHRRGMLARTDGFMWHVLGWTGHFTISLILGIVLIYILHYTGKEFALLKGAVFGMIVWYINIAIISPLVGYIPPSPDAANLMLLLSYHILYGLIAAWLIIKIVNRKQLEI
ncbi:MAG: hypothetical protein KGZ63_01840 [Clostridiales bacterium]|nr:hypothetical protein [Clostridiales bacterium]